MKKTSILLLLFSTCIFSTAQTIDALATEHIAVEENNVQSTFLIAIIMLHLLILCGLRILQMVSSKLGNIF